jgi:hypothetical protein
MFGRAEVYAAPGRQAEGQGPRLLTWAVKKRSPSGLPEPALLQPRLLVPGREGSVNLEGGPFIRAPVLLVGPERWRSIAAERDVRSARALWFNADSCSLAPILVEESELRNGKDRGLRNRSRSIIFKVRSGVVK